MTSPSPRRILVTGGARCFIAARSVRHVIRGDSHAVLTSNALTYARQLDSLKEVEGSDRYRFARTDICDAAALRGLSPSSS